LPPPPVVEVLVLLLLRRYCGGMDQCRGGVDDNRLLKCDECGEEVVVVVDDVE
jgi:hypothetical protein